MKWIISSYPDLSIPGFSKKKQNESCCLKFPPLSKINEEYQNLEISLKMNPRQIGPISGISATSVILFGSHLDSLGPNFVLWSQLYSLAQLCAMSAITLPFSSNYFGIPSLTSGGTLRIC